MFKNILFFSVVAVSSLMLKLAVNKYNQKQPELVDEDYKSKPLLRKRRSPASLVAEKPSRPEFKKVDLFQPKLSESERQNFGLGMEEMGGSEVSDNSPGPSEGEENAHHSSGHVTQKKSSQTKKGLNKIKESAEGKNSTLGSGGIGSTIYRAAGADGPLAPVKAPDVPTNVFNSGSSSQPSALSCSSSHGGGAYTNPLSISLTCSSASTIEYCVSAGACCNPETSGQTYSSNIIIGATDGTYCLSFIGRDNSGTFSKVVNNSYVISSILPHLEATHNKIYYQTTELAGVSHIVSDDFGKINYGVGVLNLKTHDPGPSGLDIDCEEIVTNYVSLISPSPAVVLSFFDTAGILVTSQLDVPLLLGNLSYGENFITTYMMDNHNAVPLYSCSTTKVNLVDFEFFESYLSHGEPGTDSVREFAAGFSPYGFFENDIQMLRAPAGDNSESLADQSLETGLFSIFY